MKDILFVILCALSIVVASLLLYLGWLVYVMHQLLKRTARLLRPPEVPRNGDGRPLKERL
jgi:hypothetical protein